MLFDTAYKQHEFPSWLILRKMLHKFCKSSAHTLFVQFGYLAYSSSLTFRTERLGKLRKAFKHSSEAEVLCSLNL